jgi:glycosyltransferase involved in cell wall biosynthesis
MISIIINCYNGEKYLRESFQSIVNQSYKKFEIIFWNNCSTDKSKEIFVFFKKKYPEISFRYFESSNKTSLYQARNLAIEKAQGKFICFLDADDFWSENKLVRNLEKFDNGDYDIIFSNVFILNEKNKNKVIYIKHDIKEDQIQKKIINNFNASLLSLMIKRTIFENENIIFNPNYDHIGDFDFILRMSKKYKFGYINEPLATYRLHENNLTKKNRLNEIKELETWAYFNNLNLNKKELWPIRNKILERKIIYYKLSGEIKKSLESFLKINLKLKIKLSVLFLIPNKILKRILSF